MLLTRQIAIDQANKKYKAKFLCCDLENLKLKDNSFDTVVMFNVMENIVYPHKVIKEVKRILKKGGYLIIINPNMLFNPRVPLKIRIKEVIETISLPFSKRVKFNYIKPDTSECACGDKEACLITTPFKVRKLMKSIGFKIINGSIIKCRFVGEWK